MSHPSKWPSDIRAGYRDMIKRLTARSLTGDLLSTQALAAFVLLTGDDPPETALDERELTVNDVKESR